MYNLLRKYGVPNPLTFYECIDLSSEYKELNDIIKKDQNEIDGYQNNSNYIGPKGCRGDTGCMGNHCMCIYPEDL